MAKDLAIILNNGSINSAVATAIAVQKHRPILLWAELTPTQQASSRQRAAYDMQVAHFKPYREHTLPMPWAATLAPHGQQGGPIADPRLPAAIAPQMRELLPLFGAAARFAAHYNAAAIYCGFRVGGSGEELAQATEYIQIWNEMLQHPCNMGEMEIITPLLELEPWQVVDAGFQVNAPFDRTWSCGEESSEPCWACRGCRARESSFQQAGKADPMRVVRKL
ncbi:MAG: 7-cyano-7-deazaguanine synthase [Anaerolineae bacterium]|nr:7-cyano-7-deazaguanine synthase [Phycisphaerae bacterium]